MSDCIDLSTYTQYKLSTDPAASTRNKDPWLLVIPCRDKGEIYPWGGKYLAASTTRKGVAKRLLRIGRLHQDGDDGATIVFHVSDFDAVAKIMEPRRRRVLSPEHKAKLAAASGKNRFSDGSGAQKSTLKRSRAA